MSGVGADVMKQLLFVCLAWHQRMVVVDQPSSCAAMMDGAMEPLLDPCFLDAGATKCSVRLIVGGMRP